VSRDIFIQDLPRDATSVADIADDFVPQAIGSRVHIVDTIARIVPDADFSDPIWGIIEGFGYSIEVNLGEDDPVHGFALHVRGDGADSVIAAILDELGLRALDSESGEFFTPEQ